ncbi:MULTISPECIES: hypothetical protein [unclassified Variovorax]|uniref:hypothetical protein n=1 Tax=unclassified Variovorax TaxID=663243 RepID=UPI0027B97029|nr:hypothetical protein [Variovorax sp. YR752]
MLKPLGITDFEWSRVKGDTDAGGGLRMRPRDMAKIGQLVLAGGRWNDRQIVSRDWIETSTTSKIKATDDQQLQKQAAIRRANRCAAKPLVTRRTLA